MSQSALKVHNALTSLGLTVNRDAPVESYLHTSDFYLPDHRAAVQVLGPKDFIVDPTHEALVDDQGLMDAFPGMLPESVYDLDQFCIGQMAVTGTAKPYAQNLIGGQEFKKQFWESRGIKVLNVPYYMVDFLAEAGV